ncbi:MAG: RNA polymerase sigma factor [Bacillota bacterium]|nr:RNA polymerase sigma factor [Bacillota bacterium]
MAVKIEDQLLILLIKSGNIKALHLLINKHYKNIYSYCLRKIGNNETALDITQDIFTKLLDNIDNYQFIGSFKNYLFTIAVNTCNDYYKKKKLVIVELDNTQVSDHGLSPVTVMEQKEQRNLIKCAIDNLPEEQKTVVILRFYHDMKLKDIAIVTKTPLPTVKSRLRQGILKLRQLLKAGDLFE